MEDRYYNTTELGELLNLSQPTLRNKLRELGIPRFRRNSDLRQSLIHEADYERLAKYVRVINEIEDE